MSERQLLTISIDTSADPLGAGASDTWELDVPPGLTVWRIKVKRLAGDCTSYDWEVLLDGDAGSATDDIFSRVDKATGITAASGLDDDNSYATLNLGWCVTQDAAGLLRLIVTTVGGTGGNTFRVDLYCEVVRGVWRDVIIPAP